MKWVKAKLIKLHTDDHLFEVMDVVPLGKEYVVDLDSRKTVEGYNIPNQKFWKREIILTEDGSYFPTEMLKIEEEEIEEYEDVMPYQPSEEEMYEGCAHCGRRVGDDEIFCKECTEKGWWMDPAGGVHPPGEEDPASQYE